jgi:hypothetical protein
MPVRALCGLGALAALAALGACAGASPAQPTGEPRPSASFDAVGDEVAAPRATFVGEAGQPGWEAWRLDREDVPALDLFVARDEQTRPLLVLLQGSGCVPLFFTTPEGGGHSLLFMDAVLAGDLGVHVAAIEKRGVTAFGPLPDGQPGTGLGCSEAYLEGLAKPARVRDVVDAVNALAEEPWVDGVIVAGHSEGASVASGAARILGERIEAAGLFSSAGPSQLADFVLAAHRDGDANHVRGRFGEVLFLTDPEARGTYRGHGVERWRTFAVESTPLDDLRSAPVPVFVAHGTADESSAVESADVFVVELLREGPRRPVFYVRIQGADHNLRGEGGDDFRPFVLHRFLEWALADDRPRTVLVGPPFESAQGYAPGREDPQGVR